MCIFQVNLVIKNLKKLTYTFNKKKLFFVLLYENRNLQIEN